MEPYSAALLISVVPIVTVQLLFPSDSSKILENKSCLHTFEQKDNNESNLLGLQISAALQIFEIK
jgi:hypothetical protein